MTPWMLRLGALALVPACVQSVPRLDATAGAVPVLPAGSPCAMPSCGGRLLCYPEVAEGFCTADCRNDPSQSVEQTQCSGPGSTCLSPDENPPPPDAGARPAGLCVPACDPAARVDTPGACGPGQVCTGWWFSRREGRPDTQGCYPFCTDDAHCRAGTACNLRTGLCASAFDPTARADGEACNPELAEGPTPAPPQCRGACFRVGPTDRTRGLCGSFLNLRVATRCPDDPGAILPLRAASGDHLALCLFRRCATDVDCRAPLRCATNLADPVCTYAGG